MRRIFLLNYQVLCLYYLCVWWRYLWLDEEDRMLDNDMGFEQVPMEIPCQRRINTEETAINSSCCWLGTKSL